MAALLDQLRHLHGDLRLLMEKDPEQEVTGVALTLLDMVVAEARRQLPHESTLPAQIVEFMSVETIKAGTPIRAADALVVVGQLIAAVSWYRDEEPGD